MKRSLWVQIVVLAVATSFLGTACTKKRDAAVPYGADRDLLLISDYDGKEFDLITKDLDAKSNASVSTTVSKDVNVKSDVVRNFDFVKKETKAELLDGAPILGRPGTTTKYKIKYMFDDKSLKVMKVGKAEDMASDEIASAITLPDGRLAVPVVSYSVSFHRTEKARNDLGEETAKIEVIEEKSKESSTHFKLDRSSKEIASFIVKKSIFASNKLDGDWYFAVTLVAQNYAEKDMTGYMWSFDDRGTNAGKVRLKKTENNLQFYNLNIDKDLLNKDVNQNIALEIPVEWKQFRMAPKGRGTSIKEEEVTDKAWNERPYMKLDLESAKSGFSNSKENVTISDIQIDDGYFAFTQANSAKKAKFRIALLRVDKLQEKGGKFQPKLYFKEDQNIFGFFLNNKNSLLTPDKYRPKDFVEDRMIQRFNPNRSNIEFRLNHDAPEFSVAIAKESIRMWNWAFAEAMKGTGKSISITLSDARAEVGDIRYNIINMINDKDGGESYGGLGPRLYDPDTGEIFSGTANMNLSAILMSAKRVVSQYIRSQTGALDEKYVVGIPLPSFREFPVIVEKAAQAIGNAMQSISGRTIPWFEPESSKVSKLSFNDKMPDFRDGRRQDRQFEASFNNVINEIQTKCPALFNYAQKFKKGKRKIDRNLEDEDKLVATCALEIAKPRMLSTLTHELGHVFGLRHNFYGSVDSTNFYKPKDGARQVHTSSVMEYTSYNEDRLAFPGAYDIAAIRWGYAERVITNDNQVLTVSGKAPLKNQNIKMRKFLYCTDEHVDDFKTDPMCARDDAGTTPTAIVKNLIQDYDTYVAQTNSKLDRQQLMDRRKLLRFRIEKFFDPLSKYYAQWRMIVAAKVGPGNEYLEDYSTEAYTKLVAEIRKSSKLNEEYYLASEMIYEFFKDLAFKPDLSCITTRKGLDDKDQTKLFSFFLLQKDIFYKTGKTVQSCEDEEVKSHLQSVYHATLTGKGGYHFYDFKSDLNPSQIAVHQRSNLKENGISEIEDATEEYGMAKDRFVALINLQERENYLMSAQMNNFRPNFFDEPNHRQELVSLILTRLTSGVNVQSINANAKESFSLNFETEKSILPFMYMVMKDGMKIPGKDRATQARMDLFRVIPSYYDYEIVNQGVCTMVRESTYCTRNDNSIAMSLMKQLKKVQSISQAVLPSEKAVEEFKKLVLPILPEKIEEGVVFEATKLLGVDQAISKLGKEKDPAVKALAAEMRGLFGSILEDEINLYTTYFAKRLKKANEEAENKKAFGVKKEAIDGLNMIKIAEDNEEEFELTKEKFEERIEDYLRDLRIAIAEYKQDQKEIDAQSDVLMRSLFPFLAGPE